MVENQILNIRNLKTYFYTDKGVVPAVDDVSIQVNKGQIVGIVGESGCGKSVTSLSILQLIDLPGKIVDGEIIFNGENLLNYSKGKMRSIRGNKISMIFQEPMTSLNPAYTVGKQVAEVILIHNKKITKNEAKKIVINMFEHVGIPEPEKRYNSYPHQLSGGLRQRVMIAMALVCRSRLLIADEPTTALDVTIQAQILNLMKNLQKQIDTSIILITHNLGVVADMCDYVYVMYAGKVMEQGDVFELFDNPLHPYTEGLLKSIPRANNNDVKLERLYSIKGIVPNLLYLPKGCRFSPRCDYAMDICREKEPELVDSGNGHLVRCFKYK
ncbi:peptide/nickel transport system ATP-binding protein [Tissierella praeacuta DSM 18095]|uniref:Peptide/nickel transport system ATP-binding protein n=1 Tax=Tissierella praeacuta DSM 18095 TaxID=1123404 RepID=A0A1M4S7E9_9FIRM|nr:ABC transporter ATP-binding protein [Tissierella praeacuta]SHE28133.1 peptide/nickel transport system ATP-binding protein [Tissierella praeacuta DSM 18095]SUP01050.1 Glutathione import ATP-binding protein GsiA [Tissierella praeacuta]